MTVYPRPRVDRTLTLLAAGLMTAVSACGGSPTAPDAFTKALDAALAATKPYQDVNRALADGFAPVGPCVAVPNLGAMGFHYVNFSRMALAPDVERPQALLYVPE